MAHLQKLLGTTETRHESITTAQPTSRVRQRYDDVKLSVPDAIGSSLFERIWKKFNNRSYEEKSKTEIEVRIGMLVLDEYRWRPQTTEYAAIVVTDMIRERYGNNLRFEPGIDESHACFLTTILSSSNEFNAEIKPLEHLKLDNQGNRYSINSDGTVKSIENKTRLVVVDHAMLSHQYDVRIGVSLESELTQTTSLEYTASSSSISSKLCTSERLKKRSTFISTDSKMKHWKIDFTEVITYSLDRRTGQRSTNSDSRSCDFELEIELESDVLLKWLNLTDEKEALAMTVILNDSLLKLITIVVPSDSETIYPSLLSPIDSIPRSYIAQINKMNEIFTGMPSPSSNFSLSFIGSKPLNITRRNLSMISNSHYFITEKSDGVRSILYVIRDSKNLPTALMMNRAAKDIHLFTMQGGSLIGEALRVGTVLDGELVFNRRLKRTVFLVFDVLSYENTILVTCPFETRLQALNQQVKKSCDSVADSYNKARLSDPSFVIPMEIVRKIYYNDLSTLLSKIQSTINREYIYYDSDRRNHKIDGIIFQPNRPYVIGIDPYLLKWKYADLRSIDALVKINSNKIQLFCMGPDNILIDLSKRTSQSIDELDCNLFGKFDQYRLLADINDGTLVANKPRIIEIVYDLSIGLWKYKKFRKDKDEPNFIDTILGVYQEQAEDLSLDELEILLSLTTQPLVSQRELGMRLELEWNRCKDRVLGTMKSLR